MRSLAFLRGMLSQLEEGQIKDVSASDVRSVLFSKPDYLSQPLLQTLQDITEERAELCYRLIDAQFALAEAGARRARWMFEHYGFYVHGVLGGRASAAETDLQQQALDVAIMYTLSHSRIVFARSFGNPEGEKHKLYEEKVRKQETHLKQFNQFRESAGRTFLSETEERVFSQLDLARQFQELEVLTLDVWNKNKVLLEETKALVENSIRSLYFWHRLLELVQSQEDSDLSTAPEEDLAYERALTALYLERMEILHTRGGLIENLAVATADLQS